MSEYRHRVTYEVIKRFADKAGKCEICEKKVRRSVHFQQTVNPWNKDATGKPKTAEQIESELEAERAAWLAKPVRHAKCE